MKKIVLSFAVVAAGLFGVNAFAQQQQKTNDNAQVCCEQTEACCATEAPGKPGRPAKPQFANPLEGITLTAEQQQSVDALNKKYAEMYKEGRKAKAEAAVKERKDGRETRKAYMKEMQSILTPEQYTEYLENMVLNAPAQMQKGPRQMDVKRGDRKHKGEMKAKKDAKKDVKKDGKKAVKKDVKKGDKTAKAKVNRRNAKTTKA